MRRGQALCGEVLVSLTTVVYEAATRGHKRRYRAMPAGGRGAHCASSATARRCVAQLFARAREISVSKAELKNSKKYFSRFENESAFLKLFASF